MTDNQDNITLDISGPECLVFIKALAHYSGYLCDQAEQSPSEAICADIEVASELLGRLYPLLAQKAEQDMCAMKVRWN